MARIRTVKPEFFRHEKLQELGPLAMLIFEGLWTQCDRAGRFAWKPKTLKLDILPFIAFDMETELMKLANAYFVIKYEVQGEFFGVIPTFLDHQRLTGKEAIEPARFPAPPEAKPKKQRKLPKTETGSAGEASGKQSGSVETKPESQEGKGVEEKEREREGEGKGEGEFPQDPLFLNPDFSEAWDGWVQVRNSGKGPKLTDHAKALNFTELKTLSGGDLLLALRIVNQSTMRGWKGFFPLKDSNGKDAGTSQRGTFGQAGQAGAGERRAAKSAGEYTENLTL